MQELRDSACLHDVQDAYSKCCGDVAREGAQEPRDDELHEIVSQTLTILKVKGSRQRW